MELQRKLQSSTEDQAGKRLRVSSVKRVEAEYKQMLRLAEFESKEFKDTLRYVEIQLAKTKE
jgi:hypothetical protein